MPSAEVGRPVARRWAQRAIHLGPRQYWKGTTARKSREQPATLTQREARSSLGGSRKQREGIERSVAALDRHRDHVELDAVRRAQQAATASLGMVLERGPAGDAIARLSAAGWNSNAG